MGTKEFYGRKEDYFYKSLYGYFKKRKIQSPYPYYSGIEDYGDRSFIFSLLGFQTNFRMLLILEDLIKHENFTYLDKIPENYAIFAVEKLAHLHSLNIDWNITKNVAIPEYYNHPQYYLYMFNLHPNFFTKYPDKDIITKRLLLWEKHQTILTDPKIREALYTFSEHYGKVSKFFHNNDALIGPLFRRRTLLHGDFHSENIFFITEPSAPESRQGKTTKNIKDILLCDWQGYGYGHPSTEFMYFLSHLNPGPELEDKLMKVYHEELMKSKMISPEDYPWKVFVRECEIRALGLGVTAFNMFKDSPKSQLEKGPRDINLEKLKKVYVPSITRFAKVVEKWEKERIFEGIDKF
jgi:hypothetical protein